MYSILEKKTLIELKSCSSNKLKNQLIETFSEQNEETLPSLLRFYLFCIHGNY